MVALPFVSVSQPIAMQAFLKTHTFLEYMNLIVTLSSRLFLNFKDHEER
jgi:hypothetical protein